MKQLEVARTYSHLEHHQVTAFRIVLVRDLQGGVRIVHAWVRCT